jgi:hypothetical protein
MESDIALDKAAFMKKIEATNQALDPFAGVNKHEIAALCLRRTHLSHEN